MPGKLRFRRAMQKFKLKPVEVEAVQYFKGCEAEIEDYLGEVILDREIQAFNGVVPLDEGDWIVKMFGEIFVWDDAEFAECFAPAGVLDGTVSFVVNLGPDLDQRVVDIVHEEMRKIAQAMGQR